MNILAFPTSIIMDFTFFFFLLHLSLHLLTLVRVTKLLLSFTGTGTDPLFFCKCHSDQLEEREKIPLQIPQNSPLSEYSEEYIK